MLAHSSSTLEDEAILIPERLAELNGLTDKIISSSGIKIVDNPCFFKGDKPAAQFKAGVSPHMLIALANVIALQISLMQSNVSRGLIRASKRWPLQVTLDDCLVKFNFTMT